MRGWYGQNYRHSLASKGIKTSFAAKARRLSDMNFSVNEEGFVSPERRIMASIGSPDMMGTFDSQDISPYQGVVIGYPSPDYTTISSPKVKKKRRSPNRKPANGPTTSPVFNIGGDQKSPEAFSLEEGRQKLLEESQEVAIRDAQFKEALLEASLLEDYEDAMKDPDVIEAERRLLRTEAGDASAAFTFAGKRK